MGIYRQLAILLFFLSSAGLNCLVSTASAQPSYSVELDLDGTLGNGPDIVSATVSDYIAIDIWIHGGVDLFYARIEVCNFDGSLEGLGIIVNPPPGWEVSPVDTPGPMCLVKTISDFTFAVPMTLPWRFGTITYHAAVDHAFGEITVLLMNSSWINVNFESGLFDMAIGCGIQIGTSAAEPSSWGGVKGLFR